VGSGISEAVSRLSLSRPPRGECDITLVEHMEKVTSNMRMIVEKNKKSLI
jgi:hypothetical protein